MYSFTVKTAFSSGCTNTSVACWPCIATAAALSADNRIHSRYENRREVEEHFFS
jgi:hypothetical protein